MSNYEEVFAEQAQEEVLLNEERRTSTDTASAKGQTDVDATEFLENQNDERRPLIADGLGSLPHRPTHHRGDSYDKAINEPWTGAHGAHSLPWYKRPSVYWLLPSFFPICIAFGGIIIPQTYLIQDLICKELFKDRATRDPTFTFSPIVIGGTNDECGQDDEVQSRTAIFNLTLALLSGAFAAIVAPYLGALSDRTGRLRVVSLPVFGSFFFELMIVLIATHADTLSIKWMWLGAIVDGLCGSLTTSMVLCFAYASDCTPPERRNVVFGQFHATLFAGSAIGPIVAAALIKTTGKVVVPFYFALACQLFFLLLLIAVIPESLSKERQKIAQEKHRESFVSTPRWRKWTGLELFTPLKILWPKGEGSSFALRRNLAIIASVDTMMFGVALGTFQVIIIYARKRFGWDAVTASGFMSVANVAKVLGLLVIFPAIVRCVRGRNSAQSTGHKGSDRLDIYIIRAVILFDFLGYLGYAIAPSGAVMVLSGVVASMAGIGPPTLQSSLTKHLPGDRTGQILGATGLLHALAKIGAPAVFNLIYSRTVRFNSGTVFYFLAACFVLVFMMSWFLRPGLYLREGSSLNEERATDSEHLE